MKQKSVLIHAVVNFDESVEGSVNGFLEESLQRGLAERHQQFKTECPLVKAWDYNKDEVRILANVEVFPDELQTVVKLSPTEVFGVENATMRGGIELFIPAGIDHAAPQPFREYKDALITIQA